MTASPVYAEWLERGRAHQRAQRPVDAMLCYRRAMRENPSALEARFHLGEVLWQLGRAGDALHEWRTAAGAHSHALAPKIALAEASLATGDYARAADAAAASLALAPDLARAMLIEGCAALAQATDGERAIAAARRIAAGLTSEIALLAVPSLAGPLASLLDRTSFAAARAEVLRAIGSNLPAGDILAQAPALLLALLAENLASEGLEPVWSTARERPYGAAEHDGVRRLARAARLQQRGDREVLAQRYASVCLAAFASSSPLLWPHRAAGRALRVLVLVQPGGLAAAASSIAATDGADVEYTIAVLAAEAIPFASTVHGTPRVVPIGEFPGASEAQALAALDADVLVDCAGLDAAVGPLLARRPARELVGVGSTAVASPLVDQVLANEGDLAAVLHARSAALPPSAPTMPGPAELSARFAAAVRQHQAGAHEAALAAYDALLALQPGCAQGLFLRGALHRDMGNAEAALRDFTAALAAAPRYIDARVAAAQLAIDLGDPDAAVDLAKQELADAPGFSAQWRSLGLAELARGRFGIAQEIFEHALALDGTDADAHYNLGVALQSRRELTAAARAYQRALAFRPDLVAADFNLGVIFQEQGNAEAAIAAFTQVLRVDPQHAAAYKNLGEGLFGLGRLDAWRANFLRFEANCPRALSLAVQALEVCQHFADFDRLDRYLDGLESETFEARNVTELSAGLEELLYLLLFFDVEPETVHRFAQTYDATARRVYGLPVDRAAQRRPGRIRVGYLSPDLRNHVMGKMIWEAVRHHDRERFELFFFALSGASDEWTERYRDLGDHFEVLAHESDRGAAERIAARDLDLLIDLATHTRGARPGILALKPARVQITHIASAGAVGLSAIDFKLTDRYADLPESEAQLVERFLVMDGCVYPYRHIAPATVHPYQRERLGIRKDEFVIGAFVTPLKLSRRCLRLWSEVLQRIPWARIAISPNHPAWTASFARLFASAGIARDRLVLVPQGRSEAENQARYEVVDAVLDPMPFGGVNGTLEALDMGVPVVTLCGRRHGERTSYSILANLGVLDTVVTSGPEYVDCAVRLASDAAFMASVRARIRERLGHSTLTDMTQHTRNLEAAYLRALELGAPATLDDPAQ